MKASQMKNAFAQVAKEARQDELLSQAVADRVAKRLAVRDENTLGTGRSIVPLEDLRALALCFLAVTVPVLLIYFAVSLVKIEIAVALPAEDMLLEEVPVTGLLNQHLATNIVLLSMWLICGVTRSFLILAVLTFMLAAAAMPGRRSEEIQEVCHA